LPEPADGIALADDPGNSPGILPGEASGQADPILFPLILLFCLIGAYILNNSLAEVGFMVIFGVIGYLLKKFEYEAAPLILALVLGPMMEHSFRASLIMFDGNLTQFFFRPISAVIMTIAILLLILPLIPGMKKRPAVGSRED
jgi:putative tricarboxylic transport membrane protein